MLRNLFSQKMGMFWITWEPLASRESDHRTASHIPGNSNLGQGQSTMKFFIFPWGNSVFISRTTFIWILQPLFFRIGENPKKDRNSRVCNSASQSSKTHVPFYIWICGSDFMTIFSEATNFSTTLKCVILGHAHSLPSLLQPASEWNQKTGILAWFLTVQRSLCKAQSNSA